MPILRQLIFGGAVLLTPTLWAQGLLPPTKAGLAAPRQGPLRIGENIQDSLTVTNRQGSVRTLISYKEPLDVLVVGFFSTACEAQNKKWATWKHFFDDYHDWHVAFLGIQSDPSEDNVALAERLKKAGLPFTIVPDPKHTVAQALGVTYTPELVIIDESKNLRYRGPVGPDARQAIEAVIGHVDAVKNPEPVHDSAGCPLP